MPLTQAQEASSPKSIRTSISKIPL